MPITNKNMQILAPKYHFVVLFERKKKSKGTFETEIFSVFYNVYILLQYFK